MISRRHLLFGFTLAPALTLRGAPADPWVDKQPSDWNEKDVQRLLTKSPWAKEVSPEMDFGGMGGPPGMGGMGGPPGMGGPGGRGGPGEANAVVRWETAEPVRAARKNKLPGNASESYVISISGMASLSELLSSMGASGVESIKKATLLQRNGQGGVGPSNVTAPFEESGILLYYFPVASLPITADDKQVLFQTKLESFALKVKFTPKDMKFKGKLAL